MQVIAFSVQSCRGTTLPTLPNHVSDRCLPASPTNSSSSVIRNASVVIACPSLALSDGP